MVITDPNLSVVITGRYPTSITARGFPIYEETLISDDDSLSLFLRSPDIFSNHISIATLDMYATVERSTNVEAPTDDEFDIRGTTYLPAMNIGLQRDTSELGGGSIVRYRPTQVESFTERFERLEFSYVCRCNDFEENPVLTQLTQIVSNNDVANDHSDESDSDIPLDHTETDDDHSSNDDGHSYEDITAQSDGNVSYHSNAIPYLDNIEEGPDDFAFMRDDGPVRSALWDCKKPEFIRSGMLFQNRQEMKGAVRQYCLKEKKEFICDQSKGKFWRVICKRHMLGCEWMIRFREISSGMWKAGKAVLHHSCLTDDYRNDHSNLNSHLIATTLIPYIMVDPYICIKSVQQKIKGLHTFTPSYRKAQKGRKKAIEMVFGDFETSFKTLPRYMAALKYFNPGTVVEWEHQSTTIQGEHIFKFLFWAYKLSIDGFKSCRPVISIDGTHLYGKYEMKLLIAVGIDANNNIFPLAYAIVARASFESWTWFLVLLWRHIFCERQGIGLISDCHQGILQCVQTHDWLQPPSTHHR
ncbi:uncharacterized protein LOC132032059 [Lycium ferocissimum]|uniref:uncharacterized protein LOC132032059 n=1 Tax=Lycium ferocissimum TaxID=112874 RepID=UPI002815015F|nr:uncharacterized protein LOC132032059 [Lycium ferocissimum]